MSRKYAAPASNIDANHSLKGAAVLSVPTNDGAITVAARMGIITTLVIAKAIPLGEDIGAGNMGSLKQYSSNTRDLHDPPKG